MYIMHNMQCKYWVNDFILAVMIVMIKEAIHKYHFHVDLKLI